MKGDAEMTNLADTQLSRIIENAIEIADGKMVWLQERFEGQMERGSIIASIITPWAIEAEKIWQALEEKESDIDYYTFIDKFVTQKIKTSL